MFRAYVHNACSCYCRACRRTLFVLGYIAALVALVFMCYYGGVRVKYGQTHYYQPETFNASLVAFREDCSIYQPCFNLSCGDAILAAQNSMAMDSLRFFDMLCGVTRPPANPAPSCTENVVRVACQLKLADDLERWRRMVGNVGADGQWNYDTGVAMMVVGIFLCIGWAVLALMFVCCLADEKHQCAWCNCDPVGYC